MAQNFFITILLFLCSATVGITFGQMPDGALKPSYVTGEVASVDSAKMIITGKSGNVEVLLTAKTVFKRVSPENPNLQAATAAALSDIGVGDRVTLSALHSADGKSMSARSVYLMTKADISQRNSKEAEEWRTRGITGRVTIVNPQTSQVTVEMRTLMGSSTIVLTPKNNAKYLRYAQDSVRFDEAKASSLDEIKQGDMLRALGDKSADGATFAAEQVVTGAFQTLAGTVKTIDAEKNEVVIKDLQTNKDVTIILGGASVLKRFPPEMAERMASFQMGGGGARPPGEGGTQARPITPGGQPAPGGQGQQPGQGRGGFGSGRGGNIDDMLERFPNITVADLKVGDMIAVSSTKGGSADRIKAIKLLVGVEPFLRMAQATSGRGRGQGVQGGFSIPGLDGIGFP